MLSSCGRNCQWEPDDGRESLVMVERAEPVAHAGRPDELILEEFTPFRLNRLADAVSLNLSAIYRDRFKLEIPEWRVLVTVGKSQARTAQQIALSTRMHKTRVSRAVASLEARRLILRESNDEDGREMPLELSRAGQRMYDALVPLALQRERSLLGCLSPTERRAFLVALTKLESALALNAHD